MGCFFHFQYDPKILRAPNLDPKKREDLLSEMRDLIDNILMEILEEQGYPKDFSDFTGKPEMESFLDNIRSIFRAESENQVQRQSTRAGLRRAESVEEDVASLMSSVKYFETKLCGALADNKNISIIAFRGWRGRRGGAERDREVGV